MLEINFITVLVAALVPMIIGFLWYSPKTFGASWMKEADMSEEKMKGANMPLIFGLSYLFSFFLAFGMQSMVIHQFSVFGVLANEPGIQDPTSEIGMYLKDFMDKYGNNFRTFKHGALHGTLAGIMIALPIMGTNALFERKSFKYVLLNVGYWTVTLAIMGGIICQFK